MSYHPSQRSYRPRSRPLPTALKAIFAGFILAFMLFVYFGPPFAGDYNPYNPDVPAAGGQSQSASEEKPTPLPTTKMVINNLVPVQTPFATATTTPTSTPGPSDRARSQGAAPTQVPDMVNVNSPAPTPTPTPQNAGAQRSSGG